MGPSTESTSFFLDADGALEPQFRLAFEFAAEALGVGKNGVHVLVNRAHLAMFGYQRPEEVIGRPILDLVAPSKHAEVIALIAHRDRGQPLPRVLLTRGLHRDGHEFDLEAHISHFTQEGETYTLVSMRDVTERLRAAEKLRQAQMVLDNSQVVVYRVRAGPDLKIEFVSDNVAQIG